MSLNSAESDRMSEGAGLSMDSSIASMGLCMKHFRIPDAEGNVTRPSVKRHSLSHIVDHFLVAIYHVLWKLTPSQARHIRGQRNSHS